nr:MAG TPA: hypothetical protein [Caudoviricetes sp.]
MRGTRVVPQWGKTGVLVLVVPVVPEVKLGCWCWWFQR